jgi:hypothetical protein
MLTFHISPCKEATSGIIPSMRGSYYDEYHLAEKEGGMIKN